MPKLSELTDYVAPTYPEELPVAASAVAPAVPKSKSVIENIINKLIGANGEERYQLWPEKMVKDAMTAIPTISQPNPYPEGSEENYWYEDQRQKAMIPAALNMSALAGTGGLAGTGKGAGVSLGIVPVDIAKKLNFKTGKHPDILGQAVENTPAASIDADGHLVVKLLRSQHPDQEMAESVRGGVFYLPEGSPNARHYNGTTGNNYGGVQSIEGETAFKNPLVVKGATGGKAPEAAYQQLLGKDKFKELEKDIHEVTTADIYKKQAPWMKEELAQKFLEKHAPELVNHASYILENSSKGNQLRYALQEAAVASAVRNAGHDGVVGYSVGRGANKGKPFLSEIYDVRENRYPSPSGDYSIHPGLEK